MREAPDDRKPLRVALVAGTLGQGGAEKQLVYMARALLASNAVVRVCTLTPGGFHERSLRSLGLEPIWVGRHANPALRVAALVRALRSFRPQVVQSAHTYVNLHAALAARLLGAVSVGAMRNSLIHSRKASRFWTPWLLRAPDALIVNSHAVRESLIESRRVAADRLWLVPNALDLAAYELASPARPETPATAILVARLIALKRVDAFLCALARARSCGVPIAGVIVGDGPERPRLEQLARDLNLDGDAVTFMGTRADIARLLAGADMLVSASDDEGCPNVVLEAMASGLPVIATPAGDARGLVRDGVTGYLVPFGDAEAMADRIERLVYAPDRGRELGRNGRHDVERGYDLAGLGPRLLSVYRSTAERRGHRALGATLAAEHGSAGAK